MTPPRMDLETARAVLEAEHQRKQKERRAELQQLVGRFFKYRNNYGVGAPQEKWWLYGQPRKVSDYERVTGLTFQHTASATIEIERDGPFPGIQYANGMSGWQEITAAEFWREAKKIAALAGSALRRRRVGVGEDRPAL